MLINDCPVHLPGYGGTEAHIYSLYREWKNLGHSPIVVSGQLNSTRCRREHDFYLIPHLKAQPLRRKPLKNFQDIDRAVGNLLDIIDYEKPDVAHIHNLLNPIALHKICQKVPCVKSIHDCRPFCSKPPPDVASRLFRNSTSFCDLSLSWKCWPRCYTGFRGSLKDTLEAWTFFPFNLWALKEVSQCDKIIVYSNYLKDLALTRIPDEKIELIHHFTDAENHSSPIFYNHDIPIILYAGRFEKAKGIIQLLEALYYVRDLDFKVILVGDGPLRKDINKFVASTGLCNRLELRRYLPHSALFPLYREAYVVAFPSIGSEGCPLVGIEAMYQGTPVVGYQVGGVSEWLVDGVTGLAVERGDVTGLAGAIRSILTDLGLRNKLGKNAWEFVSRRFRKDTHLSKLLKVYDQSITGRTVNNNSEAKLST